MFEYMITKYDQSQRDETGRYVGPSSWTCYSDAGKKFDGKTLTLKECLLVEEKYINAAIKLFDLSKLPYLRLTRVKFHEAIKNEVHSQGEPLYDPEFELINFSEDAKILPENLRIILKMIFRGYGWASLEWKNKFYVHIGWDFYMYIGITSEDQNILNDIRSSGLYVDHDKPSPYMAFNLATNILHIERIVIGEEYIDEGLEINPSSDFLEKLKPLWKFSDEHPFLGTWKMNLNDKDALEEVINHKLDFNTYDYYIETVGWDN